MKTIILGIGNQILGDDGVGVHVVKEVQNRFQDPDITFDEAITGGMNLLDLILGYDKAILIDAVKSDQEPQGTVKRIPLKEFTTMHSCNPHDVSLLEAISMAKKLGENRIPKEIVIIGIIMNQIPCEFRETLSKNIAAAVPQAVALTLHEIKQHKKYST